jgi:photosystem II stability/assembly factor-like uncharacterized protein
MTRSWLRPVALGLPSLMLLAACTDTSPRTAIDGSTAATTVSSATVAGAPTDAGNLPAHVHNIAYDGPALLLGTHEGLWSHMPSEAISPVSKAAFDVMGFTRNDDRWLASGHPAPGEESPANLGLLQSTDRGVTWEPVSLTGEVDFHRLVAADDQLFGIASAENTLLRSDDGGSTWITLGTPPLFDIAVNPADPDTLIGTTQDGPVRTTDAGVTFAPLTAPSLIALLAWTGDQLVGVDTDGHVLTSTDVGGTWQDMATLPMQPMALAADGSRIAVLAGGTVYESTDNGATFTERITGIVGH